MRTTGHWRNPGLVQQVWVGLRTCILTKFPGEAGTAAGAGHIVTRGLHRGGALAAPCVDRSGHLFPPPQREGCKQHASAGCTESLPQQRPGLRLARGPSRRVEETAYVGRAATNSAQGSWTQPSACLRADMSLQILQVGRRLDTQRVSFP